MAKQRLHKKHVRRLGKTGNSSSPSYYITLPIQVVRSLGWQDGEKLIVKKSRNKIVIEEADLI